MRAIGRPSPLWLPPTRPSTSAQPCLAFGDHRLGTVRAPSAVRVSPVMAHMDGTPDPTVRASPATLSQSLANLLTTGC